MNKPVHDSPESRQIADVAINDEEHPSRRVTLPDAAEDAPPHQPVADAIANSAQVGRERAGVEPLPPGSPLTPSRRRA